MKIRSVSTHLLRSPYSYGLDALSRAAAAANSAGAANDACPSATGSTSTALASGSAVAASAVTHGTAIAAPTHQMPATMNCLLVRVETDTGLVGWGDAFGFALTATTRHVLDTLIAPAAVGLDALDISGTMFTLHKKFHNFGRNGPVTFALSGIDIALWDIRGKHQQRPLYDLLSRAMIETRDDDASSEQGNGSPHQSTHSRPKRSYVPAYASLLPYGNAALVAANAAAAVARGFQSLKLHEVDLECIAAVHRVVPHTPLMLDVNCAFRSIDAALAFCRTVGGTGEDGDAAVTDGGRFGSSVLFVEEPLWPPEDVKSLGVLRTTLIDATPPVASLARTSAPTPAAAMSALSTPVKSAPISPAEASATSMRRMRIAAGENLGSAHEFAALLDAGAVDLAQPSVTKCGGISGLLAVAALVRAHNTNLRSDLGSDSTLARQRRGSDSIHASHRRGCEHEVRLVPHSPYFGPGLLATLHFLAAVDDEEPLELYFCELATPPYPQLRAGADGRVPVPPADRFGLGFEIDAAALAACE